MRDAAGDAAVRETPRRQTSRVPRSEAMKYPPLPGVAQKRASLGSVELDYLDAGDPAGPAAVLLHGFPECAWSWRHQIAPLVPAGYRVIVPDQRGYGGSSRPDAVGEYASDKLAGDVFALVDQAVGPGATFVAIGHDWGGLLIWEMLRERPERIVAAVVVSVVPMEYPMPPTQLFKAMSGDKFNYILYFNASVGPAEEELGSDVGRSVRTILWTASGDFGYPMALLMPDYPLEGGKMLPDSLVARVPGSLPRWLEEEDYKVYVDAFRESGYFGPVSWYRHFDSNWERLRGKPYEAIATPCYFIGGGADGIILLGKDSMDAALARIPGYRGKTIIPGAGHWTQQEAPDEFNAAMLWFLRSLPGPANAGPSSVNDSATS
ncbi:Alpha/Beta hydrolase protein [Hyaloraphidium curvatum]|nr:Alpha/Beta hydrolase protein [Hyaloraphidium curvatum]